jgi:hypothetical protein
MTGQLLPFRVGRAAHASDYVPGKSLRRKRWKARGRPHLLNCPRVDHSRCWHPCLRRSTESCRISRRCTRPPNAARSKELAIRGKNGSSETAVSFEKGDLARIVGLAGSASHSRGVLSSESEAMLRPSGEKATALTSHRVARRCAGSAWGT